MKVYTYEGKNLEEVKEKAFTELMRKEDELFIKSYEEEVGLFKSKRIKLKVLVKDEVLKYIKDLLKEIISKMGIETNIEAKARDNHFKLTLFSDNNSILIGKGGRTVDSLQTIIRTSVSNKVQFLIHITLDVENYKEKQTRRIEMLARKLAKEVLATGVETKMDSMNSYERRLVHEEVAKIKGVHTISEGEEPNRYVIIKPSE